MLVGNDLADDIRSTMTFPAPTSSQLIGWGSACVSHIQSAAKVNNASGTVTGTAPGSGGSLSNGAATGGIISGMSGSALASLVASDAGYGSVAQPLLVMCTQIVMHIQSLGIVSFASGNITGSCTNTPLSPGTFTGTGANGKIAGLDGSVLAAAIHSAFGALGPQYSGSVPTRLSQFCQALCSYIVANAVAAHSTCTGVAPAAGGPISAGTGVDGTIA